MWSNLHTHSTWCDGKSTPDELVSRALVSGMSSLGFASHAPFPCAWCLAPEKLDNYLKDMERLKATAPIPVLAGLEVDYIPGVIGPSDFQDQLDFTIGSVHFVDGEGTFRWEADTSLLQFKEGLQRIFHGDVQQAVTRYFTLMRDMLINSRPDILGHMDRIKMHNTEMHFFNEDASWYRDQLVHTLECARDLGVVVEINTRGLYKKRHVETYPGDFACQRIAEMKIPVMLALDAHYEGELITCFAEIAERLKRFGIREVLRLASKGWESVSL